ncbi:hypothetical protein [Rhodoblastus sp.]|uniref:hypothetical protein n=1 Tax=Rhodoblastus sp. TaxID=1962975 RepID=UPI0025F88D9B|nr:hypothetical protein [Rhodoblastus sp.]
MKASIVSKRRRRRLRGKVRTARELVTGALPFPVGLRERIAALTAGMVVDLDDLDETPRIATIDFEASSIFGWPIEVGWMREGDDKPRSMLIQPAPGWSTSEWSEDSGQVHYINPRDLERDGVDVRQVVDALQADLAGFAVVSDAPHLDQRWLSRLCEAAGRPVPFTIDAAPALVKVGPVRHRAGPDAGQLLRAILAARPGEADAEFAAAFLAQKGSISDDVKVGIDDPTTSRRAFTTATLSPEQVELIAQSEMDPRHDNLNRLLDEDD